MVLQSRTEQRRSAPLQLQAKGVPAHHLDGTPPVLSPERC